jgi:hypothetical protein
VTVRDLLAVPALGLRLLAADDAIDAVVRWAHPTELVDPRPYLQGGELVLTVGTSLVEDPAQWGAFVDRLLDARACAVGYGVGDVTEQVPEDLVTACRERRLPLLEVPATVPFQAITELLADRRAEARTAVERQVHQLSAQLLDAMAADRSLEELLAIVTSEIGGQLAYRNGVLGWEPSRDSDVPPSSSMLRHVGSVLAVRRHEEDLALAHRRAEAGRLLRWVAEGKADPESLREALSAAGVDADGRVVVAAWPQRAALLVADALGDALFADLPGAEGATGTCLSLSGDGKAVLQAAVESAVPCGVAAPCVLGEVGSALPAAVAALDLSRRRGAPATHRDLVSFDGLLEQQPSDRLRPFAETLLVPLAEHDRDHGTALVPTLRAFLGGDGSIGRTARDLHLHPNSLRHRLKRIGELTGADPRIFADRVALAVGLWAWERRGRR